MISRKTNDFLSLNLNLYYVFLFYDRRTQCFV